MSNEHIWAQWLRDVIPDIAAQDKSTHHGGLWNALDADAGAEYTTRVMPQTFLNQKVKRVCRNCNHGWMEAMEGAVRRPLRNLILGKWFHFTAADQSAVAAWTAKTVMMYEFVHPQTAMIPRDHHRHIYEHRTPPPNMKIWVAPLRSYDRGWQNRARHLTIGLVDEGADRVRPHLNTHFSTIGLGRVVLHAIGTTRPDLVDFQWPIDPLSDPQAGGLRRIWPGPVDIDWPTDPPLSEEMTWMLSEAGARSLDMGPEAI